MDFKVINAGNCVICGKPIILPAMRASNKLPDIFFCKTCRTRIVEENIKSNRKKKEDNNGV